MFNITEHSDVVGGDKVDSKKGPRFSHPEKRGSRHGKFAQKHGIMIFMGRPKKESAVNAVGL
jgi:hypothetical protein